MRGSGLAAIAAMLRMGVLCAGAQGAALLAACDTLETRTLAEAEIVEGDLAFAYRLARQAALNAGFTILAESAEQGRIFATQKVEKMTVLNSPEIYITLSKQDRRVAVEIESVLMGQLKDHGVTRQAAEAYCAALAKALPSARCLHVSEPGAYGALSPQPPPA